MSALLTAARALVARLPAPEHKSYIGYHSRHELDQLRQAIRLEGDGICRDDGVTLVHNANDELVAITVTDADGAVRRVLWERATWVSR